jgi:hypothetical protein
MILTKMNIGGDDPWRAGMAGGEKRATTIDIIISKNLWLNR